jgi:hypothetical protein
VDLLEELKELRVKMQKVEFQLLQLKGLKHHGIDEEMWRIDDMLEVINSYPMDYTE